MDHSRTTASALGSRVPTCVAFVLCTWMCAACGANDAGVSVGTAEGAGAGDDSTNTDGGTTTAHGHGCDMVVVDGNVVVEKEKDFTAHYRAGTPYTKTVMLFGGVPVDGDNKLSNANIFALDQADAQMLAAKYPDFYLCSSPGGKEAAKYIVPYDLVPATCDVYKQLLEAFDVLNRNDRAGGDRTSLRIEGAPLTLESVTQNTNGADVTGQVHDQNFQLVTAVQRLTGESLIKFGSTK